MPVAAPAAAFDLTTVAQVQAWATVAKADVDSGLIQALVTGISRRVLTRCARRTLNTVQSFTDLFDGQGSETLHTRDFPIRSVVAVTIYGVTVPQSPDGVSGGWTFDDVSVILLPGSTPGWEGWGTSVMPAFGFGTAFSAFPFGRRNVSINYTAGYDATSDPPGNPAFNGAPDDLGQAVTELVVQQYKRRDWVDQASKTLAAGESATFRDWQWPPNIGEVIDSYARVLVI